MPARRLVRFIFRRRLTTAAILLAVVFTGAVWNQTARAQPQSQAAPQSGAIPQPSGQPQSSPRQPNNSGAAQVPQAGASVQNQQSGAGTAQVPEQPEPETHVTKSQAKELFRSVDEILDFVSQDTGLPIEHKVKRNLITRQEVEKYVDRRMKDDKDEKRLEQSRLVLQKFGLLPPNYDLHADRKSVV